MIARRWLLVGLAALCLALALAYSLRAHGAVSAVLEVTCTAGSIGIEPVPGSATKLRITCPKGVLAWAAAK